MKTFSSILLVVFMTAITGSLFAQAGWIVTKGGSAGQMVSGTNYYLKDVDHNWHLRYEERSYGINLGWDKASSPNFKFVKKGGGKINCGDKVAIYVESGHSKHYLRYESRRWGINLVWSKEPVYEWELRNEENKKGTPILTDEKIGIYNSVENDFMIYCTRSTPTINLGWSKDCQDGWRAPGALNKLKDFLPYAEKVIKYGAPLLL